MNVETIYIPTMKERNQFVCMFCPDSVRYSMWIGKKSNLKLCEKCFNHLIQLPNLKEFGETLEKIKIKSEKQKEKRKEWLKNHPEYVLREKINRRKRYEKEIEEKTKKRLETIEKHGSTNSKEEWQKIDQAVSEV